MKAVNWRRWTWQYGLPTLILFGSLVFLALVLSDPNAPVLIWAFIAAPVLALLFGAITLPSRVWVTPAAVVVLVAIAFLTLVALDELEPGSVIGTLASLLFLVGLPLMVMTWFGRGIWLVLSDWWQRSDAHGPQTRSPEHLGS